MHNQLKKTSVQLIKYGLVGVSNTAVTFLVFVFLNDVLGVNFYISNIAGFVAGVVNSFIWNKKWVFKTHNTKVQREIVLFLTGFAICYLLQLGLVWSMMTYTSLKEFTIEGLENFQIGETIITLLGMVAYTLLNYAYNRFVTFKEKLVK